MQPHSSKAPNVSPAVNINIADHCVHGIIHLGIISSADITKVLLYDHHMHFNKKLLILRPEAWC